MFYRCGECNIVLDLNPLTLKEEKIKQPEGNYFIRCTYECPLCKEDRIFIETDH